MEPAVQGARRGRYWSCGRGWGAGTGLVKGEQGEAGTGLVEGRQGGAGTGLVGGGLGQLLVLTQAGWGCGTAGQEGDN